MKKEDKPVTYLITTKELEALNRAVAFLGFTMRQSKHETQAGVDYKLLKSFVGKLTKQK